MRLVSLQIIDAPAYARLASEQREREIVFPARRGTVFDRNGEALAISVDMPSVYTDPLHVDDPEEIAATLAPVLDVESQELVARLMGSVPGDRFEYLARHVSPKVASAVSKLELPGVYIRKEPKRWYPGGRLASHLLGFADIDGIGLTGIEKQYEDILRGTPGKMVNEQDPAGRPLPQADFKFEQAEPGLSLFLTIDKDLQYFTEATLAKAVATYSADAGTAIIMRPGTGEILALANVPDFDPNEPNSTDVATQRNLALTDMYEPGSAFKIVTASAALNEGVVKPWTTFDVPDSLPYADGVFHDSHPHPPARMSVSEIITQSSNVGTIKVGLELGGKKLDRYVHKFGFGSRTGLDFPGEAPGIVIDRAEWSGTTIATIPIGQGIAVTPLQMAAAYATIANGGVWTEPKLMVSTIDGRGRVRPTQLPAQRRVISGTTAKQMVEILTKVVAKGTGIEAQIPGYEVAGKTGTAQKPLPTGGYGGSWVGSFAGFAPSSKPQVVAIVVLDEPSPIWGGASAAPTFKILVEHALRHLGVSPTTNAERAAQEIEESQADEPPAHD